jgi:ABC-type uncharacterized transport system permease subunit
LAAPTTQQQLPLVLRFPNKIRALITHIIPVIITTAAPAAATAATAAAAVVATAHALLAKLATCAGLV